MVEVCNRKYSHLHNVTILLYDIEEFDIPQKTFDTVTCFGIFPHLLNKQKALFNMNKVLKRGGRLVIAHALSSSEIRKHHKLNLPVAQDYLPEETEMITLLENGGFNLIHLFDDPGLYLCISIKK